MVGNSFKRGMEAGAKPFEEKFRRQEQAIRRVGETISEQTGEIKEVLDVVIDELSALQKKELYDLNTPFDLKELDGADKELLVAGLYTLSAMTEQPTEHQQAFLRSVQAYLRIREAQALVELSAVENVESLTAQKAILQAFMEFLFLEREDDSFLEAYEELFEYFSVNRKTRQGILESIHNIYRAAGAKGVAEKYGFVPPRAEGEPVDEESWEEPPELERFTVKKPVEIGPREKVVWEDKDIRLLAPVVVKGSLALRNCRITYDKSNIEDHYSDELPNFQLDDRDFATLSFTRCVFRQEDPGNENLSFRKFIGYSHYAKKTYGECGGKALSFERCEFYHCSNLVEPLRAELRITGCVLHHPYNRFLELVDETPPTLLEDCSLRFDFPAGAGNDMDGEYAIMAGQIAHNIFARPHPGESELVLRNCRLQVAGTGAADVWATRMEDCVLEGCSVDTRPGAHAYHRCLFRDCRSMELEADEFRDCVFVGCDGMILQAGSPTGCTATTVANCSFLQCGCGVSREDKGSLLIGIPDHVPNGILYFCRYDGETHRASQVRGCLFRDCFVSDPEGYLITGAGIGKSIRDVAAEVTDCVFENCATQNPANSLGIAATTIYGSFGRTSQMNIVSYKNCRGLECDARELSPADPGGVPALPGGGGAFSGGGHPLRPARTLAQRLWPVKQDHMPPDLPVGSGGRTQRERRRRGKGMRCAVLVYLCDFCAAQHRHSRAGGKAGVAGLAQAG